MRKPENILNRGDGISMRWFEDGILNMSVNCIDRHYERDAGNIAIIFDSGMTG